jgi:hypothetical protein
VPDFQERVKLNCGLYIIAFECLSKLFYSFFFGYNQNRSAAGRGPQRRKGSGGRESIQVSGCFASKTNMAGCLKTSIRPSAKACGVLESAAYAVDM